jgi:hypothetical protein
MSLLRNFSPGGGQPDDDDDEQPSTAAQPDEAAPSGGGQAARYAYAAPAAPVPAAVVPSEVVTEPDDPAEEAEPDDRAEETVPAPVAVVPSDVVTEPGDPAAETAPAPVADVPDPETTWPAPMTTPVPSPQTTAVPVPSPRATGEDEWTAQPAAAPEPDFATLLLGDTAERRARWQRVQGDFVDDPQAAVSAADDLVEQTAEALVDALRQRQRQLRAAWKRGAADGSPAAAVTSGTPDTEQLRLMMQRYRALFNELCRPS